MRRDQAEQLVAKLEAAHDRDLRPDTRQLYIDRIMSANRVHRGHLAQLAQ